MLDVHPPHEAAHTWKDFFIHIATIVIGLLIAIGLEQTVELIHHRHQRRDAEDRIRAQAERNRSLTATVSLWDYLAMQQDLAALRLLESAPVINGRVRITMPPDNTAQLRGVARPSMEAFENAKADGVADLFPPGLGEVYGRVYFELQQENMPYAAFNANFDAEDIFVQRTQLALDPGKPSVLTTAQRDQLITLLSTDAGLRDRDLDRWQTFATANQALLDGATSLAQILDAFQHQQPYHPPS